MQKLCGTYAKMKLISTMRQLIYWYNYLADERNHLQEEFKQLTEERNELKQKLEIRKA